MLSNYWAMVRADIRIWMDKLIREKISSPEAFIPFRELAKI